MVDKTSQKSENIRDITSCGEPLSLIKNTACMTSTDLLPVLNIASMLLRKKLRYNFRFAAEPAVERACTKTQEVTCRECRGKATASTFIIIHNNQVFSL